MGTYIFAKLHPDLAKRLRMHPRHGARAPEIKSAMSPGKNCFEDSSPKTLALCGGFETKLTWRSASWTRGRGPTARGVWQPGNSARLTLWKLRLQCSDGCTLKTSSTCPGTRIPPELARTRPGFSSDLSFLLGSSSNLNYSTDSRRFLGQLEPTFAAASFVSHEPSCRLHQSPSESEILRSSTWA